MQKSKLYAAYYNFLVSYKMTPEELHRMNVVFWMTDATGQHLNQSHHLQVIRKLQDMWRVRHLSIYTTFAMQKMNFLEKYAAELVVPQETPPGVVCTDPEDKLVLLCLVNTTDNKNN